MLVSMLVSMPVSMPASMPLFMPVSMPMSMHVFMHVSQHNWTAKYNIMIGFPHDLPAGYGEWLTRSKFCLVAPGG